MLEQLSDGELCVLNLEVSDRLIIIDNDEFNEREREQYSKNFKSFMSRYDKRISAIKYSSDDTKLLSYLSEASNDIYINDNSKLVFVKRKILNSDFLETIKLKSSRATVLNESLHIGCSSFVSKLATSEYESCWSFKSFGAPKNLEFWNRYYGKLTKLQSSRKLPQSISGNVFYIIEKDCFCYISDYDFKFFRKYHLLTKL